MKKSLLLKIMHKLAVLNIQTDIDIYKKDIEYIDLHFLPNHDDITTICKLISRNLDNICYRWSQGKSLHSASLARFILHHGDINGPVEYQKSNQKKRAGSQTNVDYWITRGYSHETATAKVSEIQTARSLLSPASKKGSRLSHRSIEYWINKGLTLEAAQIKLSTVQTTNGLLYYINKYGPIDGPIKFNLRIEKWQTSKKANPNYANSCYMQGHGFDQYVIRHGDTAKEKWTEYKKRFAHRGSKESELRFVSILNWLIENNIEYKFGPHNNEHIIIADKKAWFFDLTIPSLHIIVEYHGMAFHPNPAILSNDEWNNWKNPFNPLCTADVQYKRDCFKRQLAELNGFVYFEIYSTDCEVKTSEVLNFIKSAKSLSVN